MTREGLCRHFGTCGGCAYQDMPDDAYRAIKRANVVDALARHGLFEIPVADIVEIGAGTRRRASFKAAKLGEEVRLGFHAAGSHDIVDMRECPILTPSLFALVPQLRAMMGALLSPGEKAELFVTQTANGADVELRWSRKHDPAIAARAGQWAQRLKLARITANGEILAEFEPPVVRLGAAVVRLPPGGFLQSTAAGEAFLQARVREELKSAKSVADLFAGCGTFALVLAATIRVHAVEADQAALEALAAAARATPGLKPVTTERRDLFKRPLAASELARFDAVILDPPRAGAATQIRELVKSKIRRIVYVSCNPESFARDTAALAGAGFVAGPVTPVDQFLWSSHIELVAGFTRD